MASPFFRKDTGKWYVRHRGKEIYVGVSERAARHLVMINIDESEGRAGIYKV